MNELLSKQKIIFVLGNSRSGTTMLSRILGNAADIYTFHELHFFEQLWEPKTSSSPLSNNQAISMLNRLFNTQRHGYFKTTNTQEYKSEVESLIEGLSSPITPPLIFSAFINYEARRFKKSIPCDQTPRNLYYLKEILNLYPNAFVVNTIRDPRAVLLSQKKRWKRRAMSKGSVPLFHLIRQWVDYHPITISLIWNSGITAYENVSKHPKVVNLYFEKLLGDPEFEIHRLCKILDVPYLSEILDIPQIGSSLQFDAPKNRGINAAIADQWRRGDLTDIEIWFCQKITSATMERHGYTPIAVQPPFLAKIWNGFTWIIKSILAFLFNFHRARNPFQAVARRLGFIKQR